MTIPVSHPWLDDREVEAVERVIRSGWIMQGEEVAGFEAEFAAFVGAPRACAVSSGTAALHLALLAAGVQSGDEVITVSYSFIATANAIRHCGAIPVFCDIVPTDNNMDVAAAESLITPRTRAILCVHQMGIPSDLRQLLALCRAHRLLLIEDAACGVGSEIEWRERWERIGRPHGDVSCFSFHPRKILTTGEGGMITSENAELDRTVRRLRQHGLGLDGACLTPGFNYRLTDLQAAIGRVQLAKLPGMLARRRDQAAHYDCLLGELPEVILPAIPSWAKTNWQSYWIMLEPERKAIEVTARLEKIGIGVRLGARCAHLDPAYAVDAISCRRASLSFSEEAGRRCMVLPLYHDLGRGEQERVVAELERVLRD